MQLATRFGRNSPSLRSAVPLTDEQIHRVAPWIFAAHKNQSQSERYTYIATPPRYLQP
jgi:hypothetical protein